MPTSEAKNDDAGRPFPQSIYTKNIKVGYKTYYFDLREGKSGTKYLSIAETKVQDGERMRTFANIFPEQIDEYCKILEEMRLKMKE